MDIPEAVSWGHQSLLMVAIISGPVILAALVVGFIVSLMQAITQIQEMTLVFIPKIIAVFAVMAIAGGWMLDQTVAFGQRCFSAAAENDGR
jgi:flagellar biosynthetic protein FliQ